MSDSEWIRTLAAAQQQPERHQGEPMEAHLRQGIRAPLALVWEARAFIAPRRAVLVVSPMQYHCKIESGPLKPILARYGPWDTCETLLWALAQLQERVEQVGAGWADSYRRPGSSIAGFSTLLYLAERGLIGIRTEPGLWIQAYERGWPVVPHLMVEQEESAVGLVSAAALSPRWCPGLPYTPAAVEAAIPEAARPFVTVEWHAEDDVVPDCPADPHCVLHAQNISRWL